MKIPKVNYFTHINLIYIDLGVHRPFLPEMLDDGSKHIALLDSGSTSCAIKPEVLAKLEEPLGTRSASQRRASTSTEHLLRCVMGSIRKQEPTTRERLANIIKSFLYFMLQEEGKQCKMDTEPPTTRLGRKLKVVVAAVEVGPRVCGLEWSNLVGFLESLTL